jgi:hypothetical protein
MKTHYTPTLYMEQAICSNVLPLLIPASGITSRLLSLTCFEPRLFGFLTMPASFMLSHPKQLPITGT